MAMPEASVNEDGGMSSGKHKIRPDGQVPSVQPEAKPERVQPASQRHLGLSIPPADTAHVEAALFRCEHVHHGQAVASATLVRRASLTAVALMPGRMVIAPKRRLRR